MIEKITLFTQRHKLEVEYLPALSTHHAPSVEQMVLTLNRHLESLGYTLSQTLIQKLLLLHPNDLKSWVQTNLPMMKRELGIRPNQRAFYPHFPNQVMDMSEAELYANALTHYWTEVTKQLQKIYKTL